MTFSYSSGERINATKSLLVSPLQPERRVLKAEMLLQRNSGAQACFIPNATHATITIHARKNTLTTVLQHLRGTAARPNPARESR
jgi:hypothetical protein